MSHLTRSIIVTVNNSAINPMADFLGCYCHIVPEQTRYVTFSLSLSHKHADTHSV